MATGLSDDRRSAVQKWLHGGIANALLHDNLEIGSLSNAFALDNIVEFLKEVEDRLSFDERVMRRIHVFAEWSDQKIAISITDECQGYDHRSVIRFRRDSRHSPRGIGLFVQLTDHIEYQDSGRTLPVEFAHSIAAA